jgi:hypothetical protein
MTSDSEDLEQQLRQNLKLRRELAAEVAKARDRSSSQRVSRSFHWLGILPLSCRPRADGGRRRAVQVLGRRT